MAVQDISYVELFTQDKISAVDYLVTAMGFTRVADSVEVDRSSVLLRQGEVQMVVTSGHGICKFLDDHGDGIADIGFTCDDVARTSAAAAAAAAGPVQTIRGNTVVPGFGGVTHTLLPPVDAPAHVAPPGRNWVPTPDLSANGDGHIKLLDHVAVCVEGGRLGEYADYYRDAYGFSRYSSEYVDTGGQAMDSIVVRSSSERVTITLVAPDPGKDGGQLDAFLERNGGPGVQHLAFLVEDIIAAVRDCREGGVDFLATPATYYERLADTFQEGRFGIAELQESQVLADHDEWGQLLQLFSRSPYERNTLFYELIQRLGSRGFGSSNIRALYEAVQRDRLSAG
ncbi:4-hydroxyphenylpyruvate dioxygenase [Nonomuraea sp. NEAU-A123]|uniref:4-hydroxyphenylpyruvate dioxygenase n=1 Tax=Nonomuraea sp. NEAU-A123 TaxID=2839649 RepID=UPI001BE46256|nr:4-hydroxyphenylpyruvate dioxygenase [Nonomuraea sp. NEAU-A123]MBT2231585.1 4-hydroxyphenylpyruvate dioxygenase [Nonomuraea sp. NEAU-A123]